MGWMRGVTRFLLEKLADGAWGIEAMVEIMLSTPRGSSFGHMHRNMDRVISNIERRRIDAALKKQIRSTVAALEAQGIVAAQGGTNRILRLTAQGRKRWKKMKESGYSFPQPRYVAEKSSHLILVIFDIPERERRKRQWLCTALDSLGFLRIQKSVFAGKAAMPEAFAADLAKLHLERAVEMLVVTKAGTLRHRVLRAERPGAAGAETGV